MFSVEVVCRCMAEDESNCCFVCGKCGYFVRVIVYVGLHEVSTDGASGFSFFDVAVRVSLVSVCHS